MALSYGLLGLLAGRPMSGYELAKTFDGSLRYVWPAQHSQIYPELARLRQRGLVAQIAKGPRGRKTYAITTQGRAELQRWLTESEPHRSERSEAYLRLFFLWLLDRDEAEAALRHEIEWHRAGLSEYEAIDEAGVGAPWGRLPLELGLRYKRMMLDYLEWATGELSEYEARRRA